MNRVRQFIISIISLVALLYVGSVCAFTHQLKGIDFGRSGNQWQMTLRVSGAGPLTYQYFTLKNPNRVVVDLDDTQQQVNLSRLSLSNTPVLRVRAAYHTQQTLRVVLDISQLMKVNMRQVTLPGEQQLRMAMTPSISAVKAPPRPVPVDEMASRPKDIIIVIDPGHGGKDPGATGVRGTHEKTVVLAISKYLAQLINKQPGFKAYLTRKNDTYPTLRQRLAIARHYQADMFVAIHADAFHNKKAKGVSVYALSSKGATSEAARWLAGRENKSELMGGVDLSDKTQMLSSVLISLSQTVTIRTSLEIGETIIDSLKRIASLHDDEVDQAAFVVLKSPDIPSLLVETGFLSNPSEENRLRTSDYQYKVAQAIGHGIVGFFDKQPPRGTTLALEQQARRDGLLHTVHRGDTLSYIAFRYHVPVASIKSINHLHGDVIHIGQLLRIPPKSTG